MLEGSTITKMRLVIFLLILLYTDSFNLAAYHYRRPVTLMKRNPSGARRFLVNGGLYGRARMMAAKVSPAKNKNKQPVVMRASRYGPVEIRKTGYGYECTGYNYRNVQYVCDDECRRRYRVECERALGSYTTCRCYLYDY